MDSGQIEMLWQRGCIVTALGPINDQMTGVLVARMCPLARLG